MGHFSCNQLPNFLPPQSNINFWLELRTLVAYAVSLLALAEIIDLTIVAVAIPHIMGSLSANLSEV